MTKLQALYAFFSSFGIPAFEENSIYNPNVQPKFPYITYSAATSAFQEGNVTLSVSVWSRADSLQEAEEFADAISRKIGYGGYMQQAEDGFIWLKKGNPFVQYMGDPSDDFLHRAYINITAEFLTSV
jgi:hypothetical protein